MFPHTSAFLEWLADRHHEGRHQVRRIRLDELDGWAFQPGTGNLRHHTGRFFTVEGLRIETDHREVGSWSQPIIVQPESGILGILVKRFDGVPHFLLQAKMEPGNINLLQMSPTVQATRSNFTRVHQGGSVPYLEHFLAPRRGRMLFDALQSEQGSWFLHKRNRNMIIEVDEDQDVPLRDGFCWLTLDQIGELLAVENLVNMDTRTVLSGLPAQWNSPGRHITAPGSPLRPMVDLLSWLTEVKASRRLERERVPLAEVKGWISTGEHVEHEHQRYFRVIGVDVEAKGREVAHWTQPMIAPVGRGTIAFLTQRFRSTPHLLVRARTEAGSFDIAELAPTVQCLPDNYQALPPESRPRFLDRVLDAPPERTVLDVVHSEEGGRFHHAENRYLVVATDDLPADLDEIGLGEEFVWMTPWQLGELLRHSNHANVEARNLLTCLRFLR